ncbi:MAG: T9SS type A sorting domain-containing protein [Bacteroidetes bacterium]|nr:T9SS type A sorting domain-containing protein [Bacteroidota bacterium]
MRLFTPNPVQNVLNVDYTFNKAQNITIQLVDVLGQVVYTSQLNATEGVNNVRINVKNYASGIYSLNTVSGTSISSEKVIIK